MEVLVNDLSLHGQFPNVEAFKEAVGKLMKMRTLAAKYGRELFSHRNLMNAAVGPQMTVSQAIQHFEHEERLAFTSWITRTGPFWEDERVHGPDEYMVVSDEMVTDTAIGESAMRTFRGNECHVVSLTPSMWQESPIKVTWMHDDETSHDIKVHNHFSEGLFDTVLKSAPAPLQCWQDLQNMVVARFPNLKFTDNCFQPLHGHPFVPGAAGRIVALLDVLSKFEGCFDPDGKRTAEGHRLYRDFFADKGGKGGGKSWFSDSSVTEKDDFRNEMTFPHPRTSGEDIFCPWHGKVKWPQLRIHFSWPVTAKDELYIVYVGPKITKY
ncbi:MAG: hypothetical protein HQL35_03520 [Alphaproteobacteria bacterium]|nr:hypothetical protein [Alphaproteobacteria bacterium]